MAKARQVSKKMGKGRGRKAGSLLSLGAAAMKAVPFVMGAFKGARKVASVASKVGRTIGRVGKMGSKVVKKIKDVTGITAKRRTKKMKEAWNEGQEMIDYADKVRAPVKKAEKPKSADIKFTPKRTKPSMVGKLMGEKPTSTMVPFNASKLNPTTHGDDTFYDSLEDQAGSGIKRNIFAKDLHVKNHLKHSVPPRIGGQVIADKMFRPPSMKAMQQKNA